METISASFDVTDKLLFTYSTSIKYWREMGQTGHQLLTDFQGANNSQMRYRTTFSLNFVNPWN